MLRRLRRALAIVLVALVGVLAALSLTASILISRELTPQSISERVSDLLQRETKVEQVELRFLPFPHVVARGVTIADTLTARSVEIGPSLGALVRGRLEIASVSIDAPALEATRGEDGGFTLDFPLLPGDTESGVDTQLPEIEVSDGRLLLRDADGAALDEVQVERLHLWHDWLTSETRLDVRASIGPEGLDGLVHANGTVGSPTRLEVTLRSVQTNRILPYLPESWEVADASGVVDGELALHREDAESRAQLDLALRGGGADVAGVRIAGETRLSGELTLGSDGVTFGDGTLSVHAVQALDYSATNLRAEFDWAGEELELHALELGTVSAGLTAAAALGISGSEALPLKLQVEKAGKLGLKGWLRLPSAEEPTRLSIPSVSAIGTELALVYDPGENETVTRLHVDRLQLEGAGAGQTPTAELTAHILGTESGRISARGSLGPLTVDRDLLDHPLRLEASIDGAPPEALLPYVPDSWVVPRSLGPVDLTVDFSGTIGVDLEGDVSITSGFGASPGPVGSLTARLRAEPVADPEDAPVTVEISIDALDLDLIAPLPGGWPIDEASGQLNAEAVLYVQRTGELEGDFETDVQECQIAVGELTLGGSCRASGHILRSNRGLGLPAFDLSADTARVRDLEGDRFRVRGLLLPPALQIESASMNAWDGSLELGGTILFERLPRYELEATAIHLNAAAVLGDPPDSERAQDPNHIDAQARVRGTWLGSGSWLDPLEGEGQLDVYDGAVVGMPLRRAIAKALLSIVPGTDLVVRDRPLPRARLERGVVPFSFEEGTIRLEGIEIVTPDYRFRAYGKVAPDFSYELDATVTLTSDGLRNTLALVSAPRIAQRTLTLPAIPIDARGSFVDDEDAEVRVDASQITVNLARGVLGLPMAAGRTATGAVRRGLGALRPGGRDRGEEEREGPR